MLEDPALLVVLIAAALGMWYPIGSWLGRRYMSRLASSCLEKGGFLKMLSTGSFLVEFALSGFKYFGTYVEWIYPENFFTALPKLLVRRRPLAVVKIQPERPVPGRADFTRLHRHRQAADSLGSFYGYAAAYDDMSEHRAREIARRLSDSGFDRLVIGSKPNITIITRLGEMSCHNLISRAVKLARDLQDLGG